MQKTVWLVFFWMLAFSVVSRAEGWIERSNKIATEFARGAAELNPEAASSLGLREFDSKALPLQDDMGTATKVYLQKWKTRLEREIPAASADFDYQMDLRVFLRDIEKSLDLLQIFERYHIVSYYPGSKAIFNNLKELINPQASEERRKAAVDRFKGYVNGQGRFRPFLEAAKSSFLNLEKVYEGRSKYYPLRKDVEGYLSESDIYVRGVKTLLESSGRSDWSADFDKFIRQSKDYDEFLRSHVLPLARTDFRLPVELYGKILQLREIRMDPEELIRMGLADYRKVYAQFRKTAEETGKRLGLKKRDPLSVLARLKSDRVTERKDVEKLFKEADLFLEKVIRKHDLVSLPKTPLVIRLANDAESKAVPVPHLVEPPLINNRGERPEFVLPSLPTGELPYDDFSYRAISYILTAHEGRPGHELQFSSMLDHGVSLIRARYAYNNVNAEGWALYAEDLVLQHLPMESRLPALQMRLWRIARTFLDPQVNLGRKTYEQVTEFLARELGLSKTMADLEARRYVYEDLGQAPAYYYGLKRVLAIKRRMQKKLGKTFSEKCFNDAVLSMGLLPFDLIEDHLIQTLRCRGGSA